MRHFLEKTCTLKKKASHDSYCTHKKKASHASYCRPTDCIENEIKFLQIQRKAKRLGTSAQKTQS